MYTTEVNLLLNKKCLYLALAVIIGLSCFLLPNAKSNLTVSAADEVVEVSVDDLQYEIFEDDGRKYIAIYYYTGQDKKISIPEEIDGLPVCYLEYSSFGDSKTLEYVELPSTAEYISPGVFDSSLNLTEIAISSANKYYTCRDGVLYNKDMTTLIAFPAGKGGSFTVPKSVVTIGDMAFYNCYKLTSVKMYNNVLSIGQNAFERCWNMSYIKLSDNLQNLGFRALVGCESLRSIHLPYSLKTIGKNALLGGIDSDDNLYYYFTGGIYYVKGSYAETYLKTLHLPSTCLKAETRYISDIDSNITLYDSAGIFPKNKKLDLSVTIKPNSSYTSLLPVRYNTMNVYQVSLLQDGKATSLSKECVIRFHGLPANTIPTATKVFVPQSNKLVEKTRAPQAAFVGTIFRSADTFVVISNNDFSLKGDIDGDGTRSVYDARFALCLAANLVPNITEAQKATANVDGQAGIKTTDATEILRYAAGIK